MFFQSIIAATTLIVVIIGAIIRLRGFTSKYYGYWESKTFADEEHTQFISRDLLKIRQITNKIQGKIEQVEIAIPKLETGIRDISGIRNYDKLILVINAAKDDDMCMAVSFVLFKDSNGSGRFLVCNNGNAIDDFYVTLRKVSWSYYRRERKISRFNKKNKIKPHG